MQTHPLRVSYRRIAILHNNKVGGFAMKSAHVQLVCIWYYSIPSFHLIPLFHCSIESRHLEIYAVHAVFSLGGFQRYNALWIPFG